MFLKCASAPGRSGGHIGDFLSREPFAGSNEMLRIAIGSCSCRDSGISHAVVNAVCKRLLQRLEVLEQQARHQKDSIPMEWIETQRVESYEVEFAVIRKELGSEGTLIIARAFVPTWRFPNFIGLGIVGHVKADGFILTPDGTTHAAPAERLWEYR
jgi:hypothetical protein